MNRTPRLSKSNIEYLDYVWNLESGCTNGCDYCYARKITVRFPDHYPNGFKPTIYPEALLSPLYLKKPSIIGVAYMGDLFDKEIDPNQTNLLRGFTEEGAAWRDISLKRIIYYVIETTPQHMYLFLTKQPQNLIKWSPFPSNAWVGQTITQNLNGIGYMADVQAGLKFISFEPLQYYDVDPRTASELFRVNSIGLVIIGSQTKPYKPPEIEQVRLILSASDKARISVFLKDNLKPLWGIPPLEDDVILRQELPQR